MPPTRFAVLLRNANSRKPFHNFFLKGAERQANPPATCMKKSTSRILVYELFGEVWLPFLGDRFRCEFGDNFVRQIDFLGEK